MSTSATSAQPHPEPPCLFLPHPRVIGTPSLEPIDVTFGDTPGRGLVGDSARTYLDTRDLPVRDRLAGWPPPSAAQRRRRGLARLVAGISDVVHEMVETTPVPSSDQQPDAQYETGPLVVLHGDPTSIAASAPWHLDPDVRRDGGADVERDAAAVPAVT